ncbi:hypothetical protein [Deinococcus roseus]|uniref:Uncharacterized protein n=1 Tax=Deinococcus roseus TaxID=392414 RepID=A0ABQ2DHZ2_9DEIO|nr:hypothetical protein [Deinococcus roseus]GGJ58750.1 hypothetical protein GCM10008938_51060 [Deinococcus roseus]
MKYHELQDQELNELCYQRLGWEKRNHLWEHGSIWQEYAWFKGETLLGFPNFLVQDPIISQLQDFIESYGLQDEYGYQLFELLEARSIKHDRAWYLLAHASPRHRVLAFLRATEVVEQTAEPTAEVLKNALSSAQE